jgi:hypothetical protein
MTNPVRLSAKEVRRRASAGQLFERLDGLDELAGPGKREEKMAKGWVEDE